MRQPPRCGRQHQHIFTFSEVAFESKGWGAECASPLRIPTLQHSGAVRYTFLRLGVNLTFSNVPRRTPTRVSSRRSGRLNHVG